MGKKENINDKKLSVKTPIISVSEVSAEPLKSEDTAKVIQTGIRWGVGGIITYLLAQMGFDFIKQDKEEQKK